MNSKRRSPLSDDLRPHLRWVALILLFAVIGTTGSLAPSAGAQGFSAGFAGELVFGPVFPSLTGTHFDLRLSALRFGLGLAFG